jgi:penicillin-binding protein 2
MFERRLKILIVLLTVLVGVLLLRAAQLQVFEQAYWRDQAREIQQKDRPLETSRGTIVDRKGQELAVDRPCVDACVDYRAIIYPADEKWLASVAAERVKGRLGDAWSRTPKKAREALKKEETPAVQRDVNAMWEKLADLSNQSSEDIEEIRQAIRSRVDMRKRDVWYRTYVQAGKKQNSPGDFFGGNQLEKWLRGESSEGPQIDQFVVPVVEEMQPHVILRAISLDVQNELSRHIDRYPGLILRPGLHRYYPFDNVACHVLGYIGKVNHEDLVHDPNQGDKRRRYLPNDQIGRGGLEWLCEPALRGTLGQVTMIEGDEQSAKTDPPIQGQTVRTSIDIDLQQEIQRFFESATLRAGDGRILEKDAVLYGAAVILDVKTNEVLALVSNPTYDLNHFDELYRTLHDNQIDDPLRNRATESQLEPGSTVKPLVGLSAITSGVLGVNQGIECTGYLVIDVNGKPTPFKKLGRCWVASMFENRPDLVPSVAHHPVPIPHRGHDGNPDGFLTYSDALERSCNVFFETAADRMGMDALSDWMNRFGLGRKTGIGIEEYKGRLPVNAPSGFGGSRRATCFFGGIGQGYVAATPIQMANVAATIARKGIWMRPKLVIPNTPGGPMPPLRAEPEGPDKVDLHLNPAAVDACWLGMINVVNGEAGTGKRAKMDELTVAGKTGTAQAAPFRVLLRDEHGKPVLDQHGERQYDQFELSTPTKPNPKAPWYHGSGENYDKIDHAWMIGFAPAQAPKIAFAVLVEYGGSGGGAAADVIKASVQSCIAHGYLQPDTTSRQQPVAVRIVRPNNAELLFSVPTSR